VPEDFHFISPWVPPVSRGQEAKMTLNEALQDKKLVLRENVDEMRSVKRKATDIHECKNTAQQAGSHGKQRLQKFLVRKVHQQLAMRLCQIEKEYTKKPRIYAKIQQPHSVIHRMTD